jgi:hypothetical protein
MYYKYPKLKLYKIWNDLIKSVSVVGFCPERVKRTLLCDQCIDRNLDSFPRGNHIKLHTDPTVV